MRSKKTFKRSRSTRVRRGSTKRTKNIKRLRIKKTKRKKEKKRNKKEKSKRNLKGGAADYWRSNFDKKISILACIGPGTEKWLEEAKEAANAVSQEENGCQMLKDLYNSHPGRNTNDCLKNKPSDVDKFVNGLTGSSC